MMRKHATNLLLDRVFESFVIDVCFVRGWTAQDLTMDSTSPPFLPMDQA